MSGLLEIGRMDRALIDRGKHVGEVTARFYPAKNNAIEKTKSAVLLRNAGS